jgi:hypothetical protein
MTIYFLECQLLVQFGKVNARDLKFFTVSLGGTSAGNDNQPPPAPPADAPAAEEKSLGD